MVDPVLAGERKQSASFLSAWERRFVARTIRHVPAWVQSHHLTLMTLVWAGGILVTSSLAKQHLSWLWVTSSIIGAQYITDAFDGKIGVLRGAGLVRWGFYMDHLLDYLFMSSILLGYGILVPDGFQWIMSAILVVAGAFMVSSFLACSVIGYMKISYLKMGPIEVRLVFIGINAWLALGGKGALAIALPVTLLGSLAVLMMMTFQVQRRLWRLDAMARQALITGSIAAVPVRASSDGQSNQRLQPTARPSSSERSEERARRG